MDKKYEHASKEVCIAKLNLWRMAQGIRTVESVEAFIEATTPRVSKPPVLYSQEDFNKPNTRSKTSKYFF
jgi:hypothetical protein